MRLPFTIVAIVLAASHSAANREFSGNWYADFEGALFQPHGSSDVWWSEGNDRELWEVIEDSGRIPLQGCLSVVVAGHVRKRESFGEALVVHRVVSIAERFLPVETCLRGLPIPEFPPRE